MSKIWRVLTRKKIIDPVSVEDTNLSRVLSTFDLTALGVGSTLGVGVYVLAGKVAKDVAGPSVVLSFLIAAVVSVFAGLCYAEFGARAPRAGSAYVYSYVCVGEFAAFVIGWNLILEYVIGSASVARGVSLYLDTLLNNTLENTFKDIAPINISFMSEYFDFLAFGISILLAIALAFGLKESSLANNIFTSLNIGIVLFVVIAGSLKADTKNWHFQPDNTTNSTIVGQGGFFPFGLEGTIKGAATCFYGFVGFDCIATTGEEVKNPKKAIPLSIILSLGIIFLAYFGISTVLTLMVPYYLQNAEAPIPDAFEHIGWHWAKWIVAIGGICGLFASLFGAMFPLPRIIYAMASDGLVFRFLGRISPRFQTPVIGTLLAGFLTGLMAALFELSQLVNMMSIGTLMAYTVVSASVLLLRYTDTITSFTESVNDDSGLVYEGSSSSIVGQIFNRGRHSQPTKRSQNIVTFEVLLYCVICVCIGLCAIYLKIPISEGQTWAIVLASCAIFLACMLIMSIATQPASRQELSFKVPLVPLIPALSILANIYLMLMLDYLTWIRFGIWMVIELEEEVFEFSISVKRTSWIDSCFEGLPSSSVSLYVQALRILKYQRPYLMAMPASVIKTKQMARVFSFGFRTFKKRSGLPTYYFSLKSIDDKPIENHEQQNGKANYYDNIAFVEDATLRKETQPRKKKAPLPPQVSEVEIQQELEKLDEMLDEVANNFDTIRKSSADSVSVSMLREENVVADVHCDNVLTLATPTTPISPLKRPTTLPLENNLNDTKESLEVQNNADPPEDFSRTKRAGSIDSPAPPDTPVSFKSAVGESDGDCASPDEISPTPTPPPTANASPLPTPKIHEEAYSPPPPPPLPLEETIVPQEPVVKENKKSESPLKRVTSNAIKSVTLKSMKKPKEEAEKQFKPDDDNLKVGSDKAKTFKDELNNKLARINALPVYIPVMKSRAPPPPQEYKKNENVIEESINRNDAKEKLGLYVTARISYAESSSKEDLEEAKNENRNSLEPVFSTPSPSPEIQLPTTPIIEVSSEITQDGNIEPVVETVDEDYVSHQNRMKNVFRSMKSVEVPKEQTVSSRIVKSLEHKLDETKHRQAMTDIFRTIQLRRKESAMQQSKV